MKNIAISLAAGAALLTTTPMQALGQERVFEPSGPWTADFGVDYCRLLRSFSNGEDTISISFEKIDPSSATRLLVLGDAVSTYRGAEQIGLSFLPSTQSREVPFTRAPTTDGTQLLMIPNINLRALSNPVLVQVQVFAARPEGGDAQAGPAMIQPPTPAERDSGELEAAAGITGINLGSGLTDPVTIETGSLRNAFAVMQDCAYDLIGTWGLDEERHRTLSRGAYPQPGAIISRSTIPFREFSRLTPGSNLVRVMVSAEGETTGCEIHYPTLSERVNERICEQVMENARFEPALDADGNAIASYWTVVPFFLMGPPN